MTGDAGKAIKGSSPDIRRISVWVKPRPLQDQQIIRIRETLGLIIFDYWILAIFSSTFAIINWIEQIELSMTSEVIKGQIKALLCYVMVPFLFLT